ncbi:hypothetical protein Ddc_11068 [Ditylenchus destructor]|nr:hypothetical protein Ddc_11068 [Ditylenchus destructor]
MSYSKPLPPFTFDLLCYLNRNQLERFSIVCRSLKNVIDRYFHSKPYRVFDALSIHGGSYTLRHNDVYWHPNRKDYSVQQFLAGQKCSIEDFTYYSFAETLPYLSPTVRVKLACISVAGDFIYNPENIAEMESITYLWRDGDINIWNDNTLGPFAGLITSSRIPKSYKLILNSPTILQCQTLSMKNALFSFKDYKVLCTVKVIETRCRHRGDQIELWLQYWQQFLEPTGVKPVVVFLLLRREIIENLIDRLSKDFSSAFLPSSFKVVFVRSSSDEPLTEFRETNSKSGEILELKKGIPVLYKRYLERSSYTLERSSI